MNQKKRLMNSKDGAGKREKGVSLGKREMMGRKKSKGKKKKTKPFEKKE